MTPEEGFQDLQNMIENAVMVKSACNRLVKLIEEGAEKNEALGFRGMADRTAVMQRDDYERWDKMSNEYTDRARESLVAMAEVYHMIRGVAEGAEETYAAKRAMSN